MRGGRNGERPKEEKRGPFPCSLCRIMQEAGITLVVQVSRHNVYLGRIDFANLGGRSAPRSHISTPALQRNRPSCGLLVGGGHQTRVSSIDVVVARGGEGVGLGFAAGAVVIVTPCGPGSVAVSSPVPPCVPRTYLSLSCCNSACQIVTLLWIPTAICVLVCSPPEPPAALMLPCRIQVTPPVLRITPRCTRYTLYAWRWSLRMYGLTTASRNRLGEQAALHVVSQRTCLEASARSSNLQCFVCS